MVDTLRILIPFNYDENWIGGSYYIKNLVAALGLLPKHEQPDLIIATNSAASYDFIARETDYTRLYWVTIDQIIALRGTLEIDAVFPYLIQDISDRCITWVPDFQEKYLSHLFSESDLSSREISHERDFSAPSVIFSSNSVLRDYHRFYPNRPATPFVVKFAVFNGNERSDIISLREEYSLPERYFFSPNQFWVHKNQGIIIEALALLKERGCYPFVCFSGKNFDPRAPDYFQTLLEKTSFYDLNQQVSMLGFIPRSQQLTMIDNALAIIQPSLFEGWSTVVEDAKSAGKFVIASDLSVHKEQLERNADFFSPTDPVELANLLEHYWKNTPSTRPIDYKKNQLRFAKDFMLAVSETQKAVSQSSFAIKPDGFLLQRLLAQTLRLRTELNQIQIPQVSLPDDGPLFKFHLGDKLSGGESIGNHLRLTGFHNKEASGIWSKSDVATITFQVSKPVVQGTMLQLVFTSFRGHLARRSVTVKLADIFQQSMDVEIWEEFTVLIPCEFVADTLLNLEISVDALVNAGESDSRQVGVFVTSIALVTQN